MQRQKKKREPKNIWIVVLIVSLLILILTGVYMNSQKKSKIYEIVTENFKEAGSPSLLFLSTFPLIVTGEITLQQFNNVVDKTNSKLGSISKSLLPSCKSYIKSQSGAMHNLLIIGDGYDPTNDAKELLNFDGKGRYSDGALFSTEPFKNYKTSFDIKTMNYNVGTSKINEGNIPSKVAYNKLTSIMTAKLAAKYGNNCGTVGDNYYIIVLSRKEFRSVCVPGLPCLISLGKNGVDRYDPALLTHEFAHGFGGLADEYVDTSFSESLKDINNIAIQIGIASIKDELSIFEALGVNSPPNCKKPADKGNWTYTGCGFSDSNYKPTDKSIMNDYRISKEFNQESKERLENILQRRINALKSSSIIKRI